MTGSDSSSAFAPAHVSGLFAVHDEADDPLEKGSRGAGWCLDRGATATVQRADDATTISINGQIGAAPVTRQALGRMAEQPLRVEIQLDLPQGQGFGMSAAGTLSACLAACQLLDLEPEAALEATHVAEVENGAGLGDAIGSWNGAAELRLKPGCPPKGWAMRVEPPPDTRFLFCVLGEPIPTASIIRDDAWRARTRELGDAAVDRILAAGRAKAWPRLLEESHAFTLGLGLLPETVTHLGESLAGLEWGQCMLGSTLWVTGEEATLRKARTGLEAVGEVIEARVDPHGARIVRPVTA